MLAPPAGAYGLPAACSVAAVGSSTTVCGGITERVLLARARQRAVAHGAGKAHGQSACDKVWGGLAHHQVARAAGLHLRGGVRARA